jgi:F420-non-reducing hydrogenase iron-sulfur subunit
MKDFNPKIVLFCCNWSGYKRADLDGTSRSGIKPYFTIIRTMCSGRVDPSFILHAFANGADGVMTTGCHLGDCHYTSGNLKAVRRIMLLKNMLPQLGIEPERLKLEWISVDEGAKFQSAVNEFVDKIAELGSLH